MKTRECRKRLALIHKLISEFLSNEDLRNLCFYLGEDYASLDGHGKAAKARELIINCFRKGWLEDLLQELKELRPNVNWPETPTDQVRSDV